MRKNIPTQAHTMAGGCPVMWASIGRVTKPTSGITGLRSSRPMASATSIQGKPNGKATVNTPRQEPMPRPPWKPR